NTLTDPTKSVLGTTGNLTLTLMVSNTPLLRLVPSYNGFYGAMVPDLIGGYSANSVSPGNIGAVIAGGGRPGFTHTVFGDFAFIGSGDHNHAGAYGVVAGGSSNTASGLFAEESGGSRDLAVRDADAT